MKIIVAIKQVPERDAQIRIDAQAKWIDESVMQYALNESDAYALEEALQLKEKHGGEVVVVSAGPERVGTTIREALAKGADRAIHIDCTLGQLDALGVARHQAPRQCNSQRLPPGATCRPGRGPPPGRRHQAGKSQPRADRPAVRGF